MGRSSGLRGSLDGHVGLLGKERWMRGEAMDVG